MQSARRSGFPHHLQPPSSSFANKSSSTTRLPVTGNSHFEKERTDVFTLSTISTLLLSFLFLPCHKFPPRFPNHAFPKRPFFSRASFPVRKAAIIFCCQLRYAQYRMRSAILRNHPIANEQWKLLGLYALANCCEVTRLRSRLISVEYVTSLGLLRQYQLYFRDSDLCKFVCMCACMYITAFASIPSNRNRGYFLVTVSRAKMLKANEGSTNSHD